MRRYIKECRFMGDVFLIFSDFEETSLSESDQCQKNQSLDDQLELEHQETPTPGTSACLHEKQESGKLV